MPEYYDYVLGLIPVALVGVSGLLSLGGLGRTPAVSAGGLLAVALVGHALFVNGPTEGRSVSERPTTVSD
jgi:hypothetical protein